MDPATATAIAPETQPPSDDELITTPPTSPALVETPGAPKKWPPPRGFAPKFTPKVLDFTTLTPKENAFPKKKKRSSELPEENTQKLFAEADTLGQEVKRTVAAMRTNPPPTPATIASAIKRKVAAMRRDRRKVAAMRTNRPSTPDAVASATRWQPAASTVRWYTMPGEINERLDQLTPVTTVLCRLCDDPVVLKRHARTMIVDCGHVVMCVHCARRLPLNCPYPGCGKRISCIMPITNETAE